MVTSYTCYFRGNTNPPRIISWREIQFQCCVCFFRWNLFKTPRGLMLKSGWKSRKSDERWLEISTLFHWRKDEDLDKEQLNRLVNVSKSSQAMGSGVDMSNILQIWKQYTSCTGTMNQDKTEPQLQYWLYLCEVSCIWSWFEPPVSASQSDPWQ